MMYQSVLITLLLNTACTFTANAAQSEASETAAPTYKKTVYAGNNWKPKGVFPLGECEGDCDKDRDCEGALECFQRDAKDKTNVPGCDNGGPPTGTSDYCYDPLNAPIVETPAPTLPPTYKPFTTVDIGDGGKINGKDALLGECQGDCDNDNQCEETLKCFQRNANDKTNVPGCDNGGPPTGTKDYCYDPLKAPILETPAPTLPPTYKPFTTVYVGDGGKINGKDALLGECQGDCDNDNQCEETLKCFQRNANDKTNVPGCDAGGPPTGTKDYCYDPLKAPIVVPTLPPTYKPFTTVDVGDGGKINGKDALLGECQGDCDNDNQCEETLKCFQRNANDKTNVPGCDNGGPPTGTRDYCYDPAKAPAAPTDPPGVITTKEKGDGGLPLDAFPLGECEGDCDNDNECAGNLICFQRSPNSKRNVPGCDAGGPPTGKRDYCFDPKYQAGGVKGVCNGPTARWSGDPHLTSFDKLKYDCQGAGEFVMVKDTTTNFEIRGRFQHPKNKKRVTVTRAVAIRTGVVGHPDISFQARDGGENTCDIVMYKDKEEHSMETIPDVAEIGTNERLIYVFTQGASISITYKYSKSFGCVMSVSVCLPKDSGAAGEVVGLLGTPNGDKTDDWMDSTPEYKDITVPTSTSGLRFSEAFNYCVDNWCEKDSNQSLFTYEENDPKDFEYYNKCGEEVFDPAFEKLFEDESDKLIDNCNNDDACIIETLIGGEEAARELKDAEEYLEEITTDPVSVLTYAAGGSKTRPPKDDTETDGETESADDYSPGGGKTRTGTTEDEFHSAVYGDPHFKTWSGLKYDYHGICDLVMLKQSTFRGNLGMKIHVRTKKTRKWSYVSTAAILIGNNSFEVAGKHDGNTRWINKREIKSDDWDQNSREISGFPISYKKLNSNQDEYSINLGNQESIELKTWKDMVRVDIIVNRDLNTFDGSLGLLGSYPEGAMLGRDGKTSISEYNKFGQEWQVLSSEPKIFNVVDGPQHPSTCEVPTKAVMRTRLAESIISREEAEIACAQVGVSEDEFDLCIFDVMAIGDKNAAGAY